MITDTYSAKTHLSRLLDQVERGEEVIITRRGKPVARLVRFEAEPPQRRVLGVLRGQIGPVPDHDGDDQEWQAIIAGMQGEAAQAET